MIPIITLENGINSSRMICPYFENAMVVDDIKGLGPVPADIKSAKIGLIPGNFTTGMTWGSRLISIHFSPLVYGQKLADARNVLYDFFQTGETVTLHIWKQRTGSEPEGPLKVIGIVKAVNPDQFAEAPSDSVEIECPDPWILDTKSTTVTPPFYRGVTFGMNNGGGISWPTITAHFENPAGTAADVLKYTFRDKISGGQMVLNLKKHWGDPTTTVKTLDFVLETNPENRSFAIISTQFPAWKFDLSCIDSSLHDWNIFRLRGPKEIRGELTVEKPLDWGKSSVTMQYKKSYNGVRT